MPRPDTHAGAVFVWLNLTARCSGIPPSTVSKSDSGAGDIDIIDAEGPEDRVYQCGSKGLVFKQQENQEKDHNPRRINLPDKLKHLRSLPYVSVEVPLSIAEIKEA